MVQDKEKNISKKTSSENYYPIKKYFSKIKTGDHESIKCELCPNNCIIAEGRTGVCRARANIDGKFYSIVYGHPYGINVDPMEKKPLYHFYPGEKILSFGTNGCNLTCKGCQNFDITMIKDVMQAVAHLKYYSPQDIIDLAIRNDIKAIAYTYNEPTIFFEYMLDIAKLARKNNIKNVIVSNGYINPEPLKELCRYIDAANIDIKGITEKFYREYSKAKLAPILESVKIYAESGVWLELTNLLIYGWNDDPDDIKRLCRWIKDNIGVDTPLHFSRFFPYYDASSIPATDPKILKTAEKIASEIGINYIYLGNLGFLDNTCCKKCGNLLIGRSDATIKISGIRISRGTDKSKCSKCGSIIAGIFG